MAPVPGFDVNPNPDSGALRGTSVFGEFAKEPALAALANNANAFELSAQTADQILSEVSSAAKSLEKYILRAGVKKSECEFMLRTLDL